MLLDTMHYALRISAGGKLWFQKSYENGCEVEEKLQKLTKKIFVGEGKFAYKQENQLP